MDEATLQSLETALEAGPDNTALRSVVVKGCLSLGALDRAREHLGNPECFDARVRLELAAAFLEAHAPETCLLLATDDVAESLILKARALVACGRADEAKPAYEAAIAANATLEDPELARSLAAKAKVREIQREGAPALKVISIDRDDTSADDVDRLLQPSDTPVTFSDVGGLDDVKRQVHKRIILPFQKPSLFQRFKKRVGGGILMYGPPGCGKTLLARATAGECDAQFINVAISDVLDMYIGESERKLTALFDKARSKTPAVIFFDELEALAARRRHARSQEASKLVSAFLSQMDGFSQNNTGVLMLAATNTPWAIDPAFRRPGRFDRVLFVPPPDRAARAAILQLHLADRPSDGSVKIDKIAKRTSGFSGADLAFLIETAADEAIEASLETSAEVPISHAMVERALADVSPTTAEWLSTARNHARYADEGGYYGEVLAFLDKHAR